MKKLFTFLLLSLFVTSKLLAGAITIPEATGRTGAQIATDISTAVGAGNTDITIQLDNGGTYGTSGSGQTIAVPAGVTKLTIYAAPGTQPTFYSAGFITFSDAGIMTRLTIDGVKVVTVGTSKAVILCTASTYPLGITIQNSYIDGFRYVIRGNASPTAEFTNGIIVNNNIFKGIYVLFAGLTNVINTQTYTNNTFLDTNGGTLIPYTTALNAAMNFTFSNNTVYSAAAVNIGTVGLIRLAADPGSPSTGTYTISNNIIASGSVQTYAMGNYQAYANLNFSTSYTTSNITYTAKGFTNIQSYTSGIATLAPGYATYDLTIGDATFAGKSSCGDPRWYYPLTVTPSTSSLTGFSYNIGSGPSISQSFTISAVALRTAITLTAPTDYEISTDNSTFSGSVSIGTVGSDMPSTPVYVRLKAGLPFAAYNNETITIATTGMSNKTVSCSGNVLSGRTVLGTPDGLSTSAITSGGFMASWNAVAHASSYTVNVYQGISTITTISGVSGTTTAVTGLTSGNTYAYKVMAIGDGVSYDNSLESSASSSVRLVGSYATDPFRTIVTGNWSDLSTWQSSPDGGTNWEVATLIPDGNAVSTSVLHNVIYAGTPATVGNVTVAAGDTLTNTTTNIAVAAGKTLTIASGAVFDNQVGNPSISAGSGTIQVNGTYKYTNTTSGGSMSLTNVVLSSSSTLIIGGTGTTRIPATIAGNVVWASTAGGIFVNGATNTIGGNLTLSSAASLSNGNGGTARALTISGNLYINNGTYNPQSGTGGTQVLTVNGNVYLLGTGKLYAVNPTATGVGTVSLKGNVYIQTPTDVALGAGISAGTLSFAGTSQQTITSDTPTGYVIGDITLNNSNGLTLGSDLTVNGALTLTAGKVTLGTKNLTVGSIVGATSSNYIVTDGAGTLSQTVADGATKLFPIGASASSYDPASVTPVTGTTFSAKVSSTLSGSATYGVRYNQKEWNITPAIASSTVIALTPSNLVESVTSPVIGHYVSGAYVNSAATMDISNTIFSGTFDTFSPFVTGANVDVTAVRDGVNNTTQAFATDNHLIINGTVTNDMITVYGLNGQIVAKVNAAGKQTVLNLNQGIYLVNVKSANSSDNFKVILK